MWLQLLWTLVKRSMPVTLSLRPSTIDTSVGWSRGLTPAWLLERKLPKIPSWASWTSTVSKFSLKTGTRKLDISDCNLFYWSLIWNCWHVYFILVSSSSALTSVTRNYSSCLFSWPSNLSRRSIYARASLGNPSSTSIILSFATWSRLAIKVWSLERTTLLVNILIAYLGWVTIICKT